MKGGLSSAVVILAGGQGTRFWPVSRVRHPKQFLSISASGESLIQATARRVRPLCGTGQLMVVTNVMHRPLIEEHVPDAVILTEPVARNTAASIGLAALHLAQKDPNTVMVVLPADHAVRDEEGLRMVLKEASELARQEELIVTIGVKPTAPHTGYGYIKRSAALKGNGYLIGRFYEKPNLERARKYCQSDDFYWNSGMFISRAGVMLDAISDEMPELSTALDRIKVALGTGDENDVVLREFTALEPVSIDFGVLEHARNCAVIAARDIGWNDVGSWDAWADHFSKDDAGNLVRGNAVLLDSRDCLVYSEKRLTALLGVEGIVVIDTGDALLVCPRERVQDVKLVVEELKALGRTDLC